MMQQTRRQILDYLHVNRVTTSFELSRVLLVTAADVRHHLRILEKTGLVECVGHESVRGRGRPKKIYRLTENALMNNLEGLASALLKNLSSVNEDLTQVLAQIAAHLLGDFQVATNVHIRLNNAVEKLNQLKYQAAWEASISGPRIIFRNCPYIMLLPEHPELCLLDAELLSSMFNQTVRQVSKLERNPEGSPHCIFITRGQR